MNMFWTIYKNLEKELLALANNIHFCDTQDSVYSVHISDLLIRTSVEIEAISKELYKTAGGNMTPLDDQGNERDLFFDSDCIQYLDLNWHITKKCVNVVAPNFYFAKKENLILRPLKNCNKRGSGRWKKAYQAVKHNRIESLSAGNIANLIRAMAALYILNLYYRNEKYDVGTIMDTTPFDTRMGSDIFSASLAHAEKCCFAEEMSDESIDDAVKAELDSAVYGTGVEQSEEKAVHHYKIAADLGDSDSMVEMGHRYRSGSGVEKDDVIATEYFRKAADENDSNGLYQLASAYYNGLGVEKDVPLSSQLWEKSAELGHWGAQYFTAMNYLSGDGVEKDLQKTVYWLEKAVEQEHPDATHKLGALYLQGVGVEQDEAKGLAYVVKAADLGCKDAYFRAGVTYFQGNGGFPVDKAKAIEYWVKGSEAGEGGCTKNLGIVYRNGDGVEQDEAKALAYFEKAVEQGNIDALDQLGHAYRTGGIVTKDEKKAMEYFQRSYEAGSTEGAFFLAFLYETGDEVEHNLAKAFELYQFAADHGESEAMVKLGVFYHEGIGTEKDVNKGIEWLEKAKAAGNPRADQFLDISYKNGEGDPQTAFERLLKLAEDGDAEAQYQLYDAYTNGKGVEEDADKAMIWCRKAADNGHVIAQALTGFHERIFGSTAVAVEYWEKAAQAGHLKAAAELAEIYLEGADGVPMNKARALELLNEAANGGNAEAQNSLGVCYMTGNGVPENAFEAVKWFEKAAEQGEEFGMKNLAVCLRNGTGTATNKTKAAEWFEKAAAKGNLQAKYCLANMYADGEGVLVNYQRAETLYKEIMADRNQTYYDDALFNLALLYATKTHDNYKAFPLWQESAQRGNSTAQYNLGLCYHNGWGTAKDDDQAIYWWQKAAADGHEDARHNIEVVMRERNSYNSGSSYQSSSQPAKSGGCYVATAVYGSYDCPQVWTLRRFRDYKLASTWYGRLFIRAYYAISPTVVKLFGRTEWFNRFWKTKLDAMVTALHEEGYEDTPYND